MSIRQAIGRKLAGFALLVAGASTIHAQAPVAQPPVGQNPLPNNPAVSPSQQIIPVSYKSEQAAAVVNGETIQIAEVRKLLDQRPAFPVTLNEEQKKSTRQAALDMLIDDLLMRQYLAKHAPQPTAGDMSKEMADLSEALKKQMKSVDVLLKESNQTIEQLQKDIASRLRWKLLLNQQFPEANLKKYYDDNKPFFDKVFVTASHILVKLPANATADQKQKAYNQLQTLRKEIIDQKTDFASAAKKYSECPSKDKGGDIGPFPYKFVVVPEFAKAAFALQKGQMSDVVASEFGMHIILVTNRSNPEPSTFEALRDTIREVWAQDLELYNRILTAQRKNSTIDVQLK